MSETIKSESSIHSATHYNNATVQSTVQLINTEMREVFFPQLFPNINS